MRHRVAGRKLGRTTEHRKALLRNLSTALFEREKITTTLAKAKELRPFAEKLVTLSKRESLHARRHVLREIQDRDVVAKLFDTLSARYAQRPGGYTRIIKLGSRRGDNAEMAVVELVDRDSSESPAETGKSKRRTRKAAADPSAGDSGEAKQKKTAKKTKASKKAKAKKATKATKPKDAGDTKAARSSAPKKTAKKATKRATQKATKQTAKGSARKSSKD